jgi:conserved oligomeric Golgi complex subunit 8
MADPLYELLSPYFDEIPASSASPAPSDHTTTAYLNHITSLSVPDLTTTEPASLAQSSQSILRSIRALSKRSHKSITTAATELSDLSTELPALETHSRSLNDAIPALESRAAAFADKYRKPADSANPVLAARRNALLLSRNVDRVSSVLELPALLSSAVSSGQPGPSGQTSTTSGVGGVVNYGSALDLHAHVKRLAALYPNSPLVASISAQSEREMQLLTSHLIATLRSQGLKLASAMRTIGWLRRVSPDLDEQRGPRKPPPSSTMTHSSSTPGDGALGALFLTCRLACLHAMLGALDPLRDLADHETAQRQRQLRDGAAAADSAAGATARRRRTNSRAQDGGPPRWAGGAQTERFLKRYIEIFREQSFAIVSMYRSLFPGAQPAPAVDEEAAGVPGAVAPISSVDGREPLLPLPSPLASFTQHLAATLFATLRTYLPNVSDSASRDSLLTQVLYCAGSMGRLGGDFGMMLALLEEDIAAVDAKEKRTGGDDEVEERWVRVMKKHRVQASRLELLASGVGTGKALPRDTVSVGT